MRKKIILLIAIFFINIGCLNASNELSKDYLCSTIWGPFDGRFGLYIEFNSDNTLKLYSFDETLSKSNGEYYIKNDKLISKIYKNYSMFEYLPNEFKKKSITWILKNEENTIWYTKKLVSDNGLEFWDMNSKVKNGTIVTYKNIKMMVIMPEEIKLKNNTNAREKPGINEKKIEFITSDNAKQKVISYIPKDHTVRIYARTLKKERLQDMEDYWYYCELLYSWMANTTNKSRYGWIYGGILK